jgi:hypothetical protein
MSMPFDATLKELAGSFPADYLAAFDARICSTPPDAFADQAHP